jgi:hypothetical protein
MTEVISLNFIFVHVIDLQYFRNSHLRHLNYSSIILLVTILADSMALDQLLLKY